MNSTIKYTQYTYATIGMLIGVCLLCIIVMVSCKQGTTTTEIVALPKPSYAEYNGTQRTTLTTEQEAALDALNTLQTNTDVPNTLYSTFPAIDHGCYPPDTVLTLSQAELLVVMMYFVNDKCKNIDADYRVRLVETAVTAQEKYTVMHCVEEGDIISYENMSDLSGTWVIPNLLGKRDVVIEW